MASSLGDVNRQMQIKVREAVKNAKTEVQSGTIRAANELRNAALNVLRGQRGGRSYKKPHSRTSYTASAPGEPPAVRTGTLRMSWGIKAEGDGDGTYTAGIYSNVHYASYLEDGTSKMAARPFKQKIIDEAKPKITQLFKDLET